MKRLIHHKTIKVPTWLAICTTMIIIMSSCSISHKMKVQTATGDNVPLTGGILYALPRTQVQVALKVSYVDYTEAPYHQYAQQYLSGNKVNNSGTAGEYQLQCARISAVASPDKKNIYYVEPGDNTLYVDSRGILLALNMTPREDSLPTSPFAVGPTLQFFSFKNNKEDAENIVQNKSYQHLDSFYVRTDPEGHPTLMVSKVDQLALKEQAAVAAEKLKAIDDKQQQLLFGEYEGNYAPESIHFLYDQLKKMKESYLRMFLGDIKTDSIVCYIDPAEESDKIDSQTVVLCYFSPSMGLCHDSVTRPADARPVTCTIICDNGLRRVTRAAANKQKKNIGSHAAKHNLRYRMPQEAIVSIKCDGFAEISQRLPIMQFGASTLLPSGKVKACFDSRTGALLYISAEKQTPSTRVF